MLSISEFICLLCSFFLKKYFYLSCILVALLGFENFILKKNQYGNTDN